MRTSLNHRSTRRARTARTVIALGLAVGAFVAVPSAASAAAPVAAASTVTPSPAQDDDTIAPRLEFACRRIPNLQIRTENVLARIQGDADTRGSLAWLQLQIDRAEASGRTQWVTVLENRFAVRESMIPVLKDRQVRLAELLERCRAKGVDV